MGKENIHYMLDDEGNVVTTNDLEEWGKWFEKADRRIRVDDVRNAQISTVFLSVDHSFDENDPPVLYETMIFGGQFDEFQWRYHTKEDAIEGHERIKKMVMLGVEPSLED